MKTYRAYSQTQVSPAKSQEGMRKQLLKHGIEEIRFTETRSVVAIEFNCPKRLFILAEDKEKDVVIGIRIEIGVPSAEKERDSERMKRQCWRALFYTVKVKLEIVSFGTRTLAEEFLGDILLRTKPGGPQLRLIQVFGPQLEKRFLEGHSQLRLLDQRGE